MNKLEQIHAACYDLLKQLITFPSFSKEENLTADLIYTFIEQHGIEVHRIGNNVWAKNKHYVEGKPNLLLNSHHDTVKPNKGYSLDPFQAIEKDEKLYGLGSNDAGGCLVSLLACFLNYYEATELPYNIIFGASAEEEITGINGIELLLKHIPNIDLAIVGEPTLLNLAIAEKGLVVVEAICHGKSGHAAREEGENALYKAIDDIAFLKSYQFDKVSELLGPVKMSVTMINAGTQHNVVPDQCQYTIDIRLNEHYEGEKVIEELSKHLNADLRPKSFRIRPSFIPEEHLLIKAGKSLKKSCYGSPTTSDQALIPCPSLKCGPGDSARSHSADEYIYINEIHEGIDFYINLIQEFFKLSKDETVG